MREQLPRLPAAWLGVPLLAFGCRGEPAASLAPETTASAPAPAAAVAPAASAESARAAAPSPAHAQPTPSSSGAAAGSAESPPTQSVSDDPPLLGLDGAALPQTEARPTLSSPSFQRRMRELGDSILTGDVERGRKSFFPLVAYAQVKDVQKPERDYRYRLMAHFERDVREYARQLSALGKGAEQAEFLGVDVPEPRAQWMKPGKEGNRLGYFRVLRSRLRFRLAGGAEKTFELTSMISWRGEWYVVHLHGFE